jgi:hypothetical protein
MLGITEIFRTHGPAYRERFDQTLLPSHRKTIADIIHCRTDVMGGHAFVCDACEHVRYAYHSCKNRSRPTCHETDRKVWLEKRKKERLPVPYFHAVFTLPKQLHPIIKTHQKIGYALLMEAAALSLMKLASDIRYVGGQIGLLSVLHTWTRALLYHPHVHCLIPAGGLSGDHRYWLAARKNYLVPVRALSDIFRATFMTLARRKLPGVAFPQSVWNVSWVVYCKSGPRTADYVLDYLARYVHQTALANSRILSTGQGKVTFRYKDSQKQQWKIMTLTPQEFMRRFLQHVLPPGFHKVRYYGLMAPRNRQWLNKIRRQLTLDAPLLKQETKGLSKEDNDNKEGISKKSARPMLCPVCQKGHLIPFMVIPRQWRAPP